MGTPARPKRQWEVTGEADGRLVWTSMTAKEYVSEPLDYRDF